MTRNPDGRDSQIWADLWPVWWKSIQSFPVLGKDPRNLEREALRIPD